MSLNQDKYRLFSAVEATIPLFMKGWWLDAVCGSDDWDVCLLESGNHVQAALPYHKQKRLIFTLIKMPALSSGWGPWISYPNDQKYASKLSFEHQTISQLISQLPEFDYFNQRFRYSVVNNQAFYWNDFKLTLRYNYILPDLTDLDAVFAGFNANTRREIKKAQKVVQVIETEDADLFYQLNQKTFEKNRVKIPYSQELLQRIDDVCQARNCRKIFLAIDKDKAIHAALYLVWDDNSAYYLMGSMNHQYKSGAFSLLMWHAIQHAATKKLRFDFEGSMIESVERFFREFGAQQVVYAQVQKTNSKLLRLATFLNLV